MTMLFLGREVRVTQVNVAEAKTHLSELIEAALAGDEVVIARNGKPMVKLVVVRAESKRQTGFLPGGVWLADDFDAPLEDFAEYER